MASKKRPSGKNSSRNGNHSKTGGKSPGSSRKSPAIAPEDSVSCQVTQFSFGILAALLLLILILTDLKDGRAGSTTGLVGYYLCKGLYGLFGRAVWLLPAALIYLTVFWRRAVRTHTAIAKSISAATVILVAAAFLFSQFTLSSDSDLPKFYNLPEMWKLSFPEGDAAAVNWGGVLGALFGGLLSLLFKRVAWLIEWILLTAALLILIELPPMKAIRAIGRLFAGLFARIRAAILARRKKKTERAAQDEEDGCDDGSDKPESEPAARPRIFPEEYPAEKPEGGSRKPVGITPVRFEGKDGKGGSDSAVSDLPITDPIPPVLPEEFPPKKSREEPKKDGEPYVNPYADPETQSDKGDPDLMELLFPEGEAEPAPAGGDVNVVPRRPERRPAFDGSDALPADEFEQSGPDRPEVDSAPSAKTKPESEKSTAQQFAEVSDLQDSDENDHALTDPDPVDPDEILVKPEYKFPPLTLLKKDTGGMNADHSAELQANGVKLVRVLESFKVKTKITNISRGPTITRYELLPDEGVRVRAIANLVDDIALNLATSGVRIEAPIPGKAAVGIEVPNAQKETVYLRDLLENPMFTQAGSKVTAALGMDVAGEPIFVDIAKMPHLLIAGTTGSGKSVCINSLITSLLFRATPEEVKFILIDPKKVELGVYNRLPHLLVPVVTNPKKAAGALTWAVTEMERRYETIEQAGVRNNKGYNKLIEDGELEGEKMPSIIIVIDELADLMMTAPDTVEESICRLAQKARAAGMFLIIGTQRPSVDVITGLIKANIPSRIAFTVKSIVDSRTIIDIGGAEKLIGYGDMLYAPVGAMKPVRVQGAFVSDKEVEAVCDFIREESGESAYDQKTIDEIREHEAECEEAGKKGFSSGDEDEEEDPKFMDAVRVAVEEGKISTSLLQRRLQLGYGRAAKIIDRMEKMGIVSPPDGQKPRNVLIGMQDYQEMLHRNKE